MTAGLVHRMGGIGDTRTFPRQTDAATTATGTVISVFAQVPQSTPSRLAFLKVNTFASFPLPSASNSLRLAKDTIESKLYFPP